ncbi:5'-deoxynucleotidase [Aristaeella hokkaidonensis]|uniref:5'-deoxynucleotidase n=1 Tax=Aristaeella hokkaidonensis TaxID=3046382 RepID=A0AC61MXE0_9FIRM|nr:5'-deoxynucleotidase [Aristaeella hokkaidonensis]QUC67432.1 5'-deoxynucleotidase [Aristaeella hokkaidonensis]SNT92464.1 5'-deoxynucleotidase [Aristaeella hokkaidonensis]
MSFPFFAYLSRLRLIHRWSLMRNTVPENDAEHSLQVAMIAHAIAIIAQDRYGKDVDPEHVLSLAVYHDATEVMTGDLPTPVKYHSDELRGAYHRLEELSADRLLALLPEDLQPAFTPYMKQASGYEHTLVKAADRISACIKCMEEQRAGNREFDYAAENIRDSISAIDLPEVKDFLTDFLPAFDMTLDELNHPSDENR